jgi:hypothetical protein
MRARHGAREEKEKDPTQQNLGVQNKNNPPFPQ